MTAAHLVERVLPHVPYRQWTLIGILLASWLTLRLRLGTLPEGMTLRHLVVLGVVAGVGFTMALFIAQLAFTAWPLRRSACSPRAAAQTADEAESSTEA